MNIAFITLGFTPVHMSGFDISGERLLKGLLEYDHQVTVITGSYGKVSEVETHPGLKILRIPIGSSNWIGFAYRAANLLQHLEQKQSWHIKHFWDVHFAYAYRGSFVATLHHSFQQRIVTSNYRLHKSAYYWLARYLAEIPSLARARGLFAVSSTTRAEFINNYGVHPEKIILASHGIDTNFFYPRPEATDLRRRLGIGAQEPVIMFAGFVTARKGLEYLAQAMSFIKPTPYLILAGRWSKLQRNNFMKMVAPIQNRVIEAGFIPDHEMPVYYSLTDVYVSASLLEGFGLPLAEALACGTPVVCAQVGSVEEVVGPGGIMVPAREPVALAEAVTALLADPARRKALGASGRQHISLNFNQKTNVETYIRGYEQLRG